MKDRPIPKKINKIIEHLWTAQVVEAVGKFTGSRKRPPGWFGRMNPDKNFVDVWLKPEFIASPGSFQKVKALAMLLEQKYGLRTKIIQLPKRWVKNQRYFALIRIFS